MNKYTERAYRFFSTDVEAKEALKNFLNDSHLTDRIANNLEEYSEQLSHMELLGIFRAVKVSVVEAVDWKEVAYLVLADEWNVPPTGGASIPEWSDDFDSNEQ